MRRITTLPCLFLLSTACSTSDDDVATDSTSGAETSSSSMSMPSSAGDQDGTTTSSPSTSGSSSATTHDDGDEETTTGSTSEDDEGSTTEGGELRPGPDFRLLGPHDVSSEDGSYAIKPGCNMAYTRFVPDGEAIEGTVILAHGFMGNRNSMAGWAEHLASWGLEVFTPDLCHATFIDSDHAQNGTDLIALREHLSLASVVYAGYSAGGLAAFLAAADDASTIAVLGLDMVDSDDLGAGAAASVNVPAHDIVAEPAMCNTSGNGIAPFNAAAQGRVLRVTEADHCDFQNPGDFLCGTCSAANPTYDTATIQSTIIGLSTGFLLWQTSIDATGQQWWFEGEPWFDDLASTGIITAQ